MTQELNPKKLMLGDWVIIKKPRPNGKDLLTQVRGIGEDCILVDDGHAISPKPLDRVEDVPFFLKYIENNGFKKIKPNNWLLYSNDEPCPYEINLEDEGHFLYITIKTYDASIFNKIWTIREYQHCLRECGLDTIADNLQIEL